MREVELVAGWLKYPPRRRAASTARAAAEAASIATRTRSLSSPRCGMPRLSCTTAVPACPTQAACLRGFVLVDARTRSMAGPTGHTSAPRPSSFGEGKDP